MRSSAQILCVLCVAVSLLPPRCLSMKCYICDDVQSCENPALLKCNTSLVEKSTEYLNVLHTVFKTKPHMLYYDCFHEDITFYNGAFYTYRGCIFRHWSVCDLPVELMQTYDDDVIRKCYQCNWRYGCNAAASPYSQWSFVLILVSLIVGFNKF